MSVLSLVPRPSSRVVDPLPEKSFSHPRGRPGDEATVYSVIANPCVCVCVCVCDYV
jgi:hypothetical protein